MFRQKGKKMCNNETDVHTTGYPPPKMGNKIKGLGNREKIKLIGFSSNVFSFLIVEIIGKITNKENEYIQWNVRKLMRS